MSVQPGCLGQFLRLLGFQSQKDHSQVFPYAVRDDFLSVAELSFYQVLQTSIGADFAICVKVNLADLFFVKGSKHNWTYLNRIGRKHVDYVLCDQKTMHPVCGIELDDISHSRPDRAQRDQFVNKVFQSAGLPLIRIRAAKSYSLAEIENQIRSQVIQREPAPKQRQMQTVSDAGPLCPKCQQEMVLRVARQGKNQGEHFWGCSNFPRCRQVAKYATQNSPDDKQR